MKIFTSLKEAQDAQESGEVFVHIHRLSDDKWEAYEPRDPIPPEYLE